MKMRLAIKRQRHPYVNSVLNSQHVSTHGVYVKSKSPAGVYLYSEIKCARNDSRLHPELLPSPDVMPGVLLFDAAQLVSVYKCERLLSFALHSFTLLSFLLPHSLPFALLPTRSPPHSV